MKFIISDISIAIYFWLSYFKHNLKGARIHSTCKISTQAVLEPGTGFYGNTKISGPVKIGRFTYATDSIIQNCTIGKFCSIAPGVKIGLNEHPLDEVLLHPMGYADSVFNKSISPVIIGNDVWIGANAVILSGVRIGNGAVIAAGAIVNKDVEAFAIVAGVPARKIKSRVKSPLFDKIMECRNKGEAEKILKSKEKV